MRMQMQVRREKGSGERARAGVFNGEAGASPTAAAAVAAAITRHRRYYYYYVIHTDKCSSSAARVCVREYVCN